jgi:glucokinase
VGKLPGQSCLGAIDIGGTKIRVACLDSNLDVVSVHEFPTAAASSANAALNRATGPVDPISGIVGDVELLPGWQGFPLTKYLEDRFAAPAILENDCDAAALGESHHEKTASRLLYVSLSTGIGAGIVIDSKLYRGHQGAHPELGHMVLDPAGPLCYCGARGCWESLASGPALARSHGAATDAREVFSLARQKDPRALAALEKFRAYTAQGLGNLITLFAPETIVVGGGGELMDRDDVEIRVQAGNANLGATDIDGAKTRLAW